MKADFVHGFNFYIRGYAMADTKDKSRFTRREFLITLEGLIGATVVGWIVVPEARQLLATREQDSSFPELLDCLVIKDIDGRVGLFDASDPGNPMLVCEVNQIGGYILGELNGKNAFDDIVRRMTGKIGREPSNFGTFASGIATFIARLAEAGFLKNTFLINIVENTVAS
jgi:hypothetical protein